jgi:hypothetical protein
LIKNRFLNLAQAARQAGMVNLVVNTLTVIAMVSLLSPAGASPGSVAEDNYAGERARGAIGKTQLAVKQADAWSRITPLRDPPSSGL